MIKNIIFFYIIFYSFNSFAQENSKFKNEKWVMEYLLKYVIEQPSDTQYIEIRESNLRIKTKYCDYQKIILSDTLDSENIYFIEIASKKFELNKHHITLDSGIVIQEYYPKKAKRFGSGKIDGYDVYGTDIDLPNTEIGVFNIKINEKKSIYLLMSLVDYMSLIFAVTINRFIILKPMNLKMKRNYTYTWQDLMRVVVIW